MIETITDPFAADIMYHRNCWQKYVCNSSLDASDRLHLQQASLSDCRSLFFRHIDDVIFDQHEICTLQSLLQDYKSIVTNHGYPVGDIKSSYLKELLQSEYKGNIGFHVRNERNSSDWVYNTRD